VRSYRVIGVFAFAGPRPTGRRSLEPTATPLEDLQRRLRNKVCVPETTHTHTHTHTHDTCVSDAIHTYVRMYCSVTEATEPASDPRYRERRSQEITGEEEGARREEGRLNHMFSSSKFL